MVGVRHAKKMHHLTHLHDVSIAQGDTSAVASMRALARLLEVACVMASGFGPRLELEYDCARCGSRHAGSRAFSNPPFGATTRLLERRRSNAVRTFKAVPSNASRQTDNNDANGNVPRVLRSARVDIRSDDLLRPRGLTESKCNERKGVR